MVGVSGKAARGGAANEAGCVVLCGQWWIWAAKRSEGSQGTTDSYSCNPLSEKDMEELQSTLPPDKKLKAGREYIWNRKSKRKAEYWKYYLEYVENGKLRAECIDDKLFTVTVDNASSNDVACAHLSRMVRRTGCINDGKNLHVRCIAHIINLIVWDGIREHGVCIDRVRNAVKYVKNSLARILRFKDLVQKANIDSKSSLSFDVPTRWNSTYIMLETTLKFRRVFSGLSLPDGEDLNDNERPPEPEDWEKVERLVLFLGGFYLLTKRISGSHYVTANKGLGEIASMYDMLNNWEQSEDLNFQAMAIAMKKKFDKYWGDVDKMNKFIYVALLLDPHSKMVIVELTLTDMHGPEKGTKLANDVKEFAYSLFEEYRKMYATYNIPDCGDNMSMDIDNSKGVGSDYVRKLKERAKRLKGTSGKNGQRYVILNRMARDILAIPLSTVASESAFSTGGRTLDPFRSSLTPKMVQALLCTQDWLRAKEVPIVDVEENLKELEEIEKEVQRGESNDVDDEVVFVDSLV
uniref:Transposase n=1 Tax=Chenopodium quinoa TaxID=63459 RepID=A0A803MY41_CHEQI